jgi:hypothetical protein
VTPSLPIRAYGDFSDVPRLFIVRDGDRDLVFDGPFRDDLDAYDDEFTVFESPTMSDTVLSGSWLWADTIEQTRPIARIPVGSVRFDSTKRASINADVLELVRRRADDPALAPLITSIEQLRPFDDPIHTEQPPDFDEGRARASVEALINRANVAFRTGEWSQSGVPPIDSEIGFPLIQDATHFASLTIPAVATAGREELFVVVSRFGRLLAIATNELETPSPRSAADRNRLAAIGAVGGYRIVFGDLLAAPYDGKNEALKRLYADHPQHLTWWVRFFDWI